MVGAKAGQVPGHEGSIEVVTRQYTTRELDRDKNDEIVRDGKGSPVYVETVRTIRSLRFKGSLSTIAAISHKPEEGQGYPGTPHTQVRVVDMAKDQYAPQVTKAKQISAVPLVLPEAV